MEPQRNLASKLALRFYYAPIKPLLTKPHESLTKPRELLHKPHQLLITKSHELLTQPHELLLTKPHELLTKPRGQASKLAAAHLPPRRCAC